MPVFIRTYCIIENDCRKLLIGFKIFVLVKGLPNAVNKKGAVSPATLATLSMVPCKYSSYSRMEEQPLILFCNRGHPVNSDASFKESGISFNVSSVDLIMEGSMISESAMLPDKAENPPKGFTTHR